MNAVAADLRRDAALIGLVSSAHLSSHFFQISLSPLFPLLKDDFGVSYTALGAMMTLFYGTSGLAQAFVGILVDRFGGRRMMVIGLAMLSTAMGLTGLAPQFWMLFPLLFIAGVGNCVFHPADLAILSAKIGKGRLGRAFSVHSFCGYIGYSISPVVIGAMTLLWGWRAALLTAGCLGLAVVAVLIRFGDRLETGAAAPAASGRPAHADQRINFASLAASPAIVAGFFFFALSSTVSVGLQTSGVPAIMAVYDVPLALATGVLTAYLVGSMGGILIGGVLVDRTDRHDLMAIVCVLAAAAMMVAIASAMATYSGVVALAALAGAGMGMVQPARDVLVRGASPPGAAGRVFGLVYSGLDLGSSMTPIVIGWLLDHGEPNIVFVVFAAAQVLTVATVIQVRRHAIARATPAA